MFYLRCRVSGPLPWYWQRREPAHAALGSSEFLELGEAPIEAGWFENDTRRVETLASRAYPPPRPAAVRRAGTLLLTMIEQYHTGRLPVSHGP